jgi:hypothetical protein
MGPLDLAVDALGISPKDAALWIAERFDVPQIAPRKHIKEPRRLIHMAGFETALGLLIRSGVWSTGLSPVAQRLAAVLLELGNFRATAASEERDKIKSLDLSYRAMARYAGSSAGAMSPSAIAKGLSELEAIGWLQRQEPASTGPTRKVACYRLTPFSEQVCELANGTAAELRNDIAIEKELRRTQRQKRIDAIPTVASNKHKEKKAAKPEEVITKYKSLFSQRSVEQADATVGVA